MIDHDRTTVEHRTFCRICTAMCGLVVTLRDEEVLAIRGDHDHALSRGYTCEKGRALGHLHSRPDRLDHPMMGRAESRAVVDWDLAIDDLGARVGDLLSSNGPESIAMYLASGSAFDTAGRRAAEKFLRLIGSPQNYTATTIDTPCRPFVAEVLGGWSGLTPIWDESGDLLILVGSNPVVSHGHSNAMPDPIRRFRDARRRGCRIVVIDPRRSQTAELADLHLQVRPGSDWLLLAWIVRNLASSTTAHDEVTGVDELARQLDPLDLATVARLTDLPADDIELLDRLVTDAAGRVSVLTGTGTTMGRHAVVTEHLAWCIVALTGSFERPGGMWFNPGIFGRLDERELPAGDGTPGAGPASRPELPRRFGEWPCAGLVDEIESGTVRALFVVGGNPALAFPDTTRTREALASLDILAVVDILPTETTRLATHVLPAVDPLERADATVLLDSYQLAVAGQFTTRVVAPREERRPVWWTFGTIAERMGLAIFDRPTAEITEVSLLEPLLDRSVVGADALRASESGIVASGPRHGWVRDRVLPGHRWRLGAPVLIDHLRSALETIDADDHTLRLIPHRRRSMMNSQFDDLGGDSDRISVRAAPATAAALGPDGIVVRVITSNGSTTGPLLVDDRLHPEAITISHGSADCNVSELTSATSDVDPATGMVLQSGIECRVEVADP